jgi:hypothetical protein
MKYSAITELDRSSCVVCSELSGIGSPRQGFAPNVNVRGKRTGIGSDDPDGNRDETLALILWRSPIFGNLTLGDESDFFLNQLNINRDA